MRDRAKVKVKFNLWDRARPNWIFTGITFCCLDSWQRLPGSREVCFFQQLYTIYLFQQLYTINLFLQLYTINWFQELYSYNLFVFRCDSSPFIHSVSVVIIASFRAWRIKGETSFMFFCLFVYNFKYTLICQLDEDWLDEGWHVCMQLMSATTPDWPNLPLPCRDLVVRGEL